MSRTERILEIIKNFNLVEFELINESDSHAGPKGRETHFKLLLVSQKFENLSRVDRQRLIYQMLNSEMQSGLHALSLRALTPQEWSQTNQNNFQSPECTKK